MKAYKQEIWAELRDILKSMKYNQSTISYTIIIILYYYT